MSHRIRLLIFLILFSFTSGYDILDPDTRPLLSFLVGTTPPSECIYECTEPLKQPLINFVNEEITMESKDDICSAYEKTTNCIQNNTKCTYQDRRVLEKLMYGFRWACGGQGYDPFEHINPCIVTLGKEVRRKQNCTTQCHATLKRHLTTESNFPNLIGRFEHTCEPLACFLNCTAQQMNSYCPTGGTRLINVVVSAIDELVNEYRKATRVEKMYIKKLVPDQCALFFSEKEMMRLRFRAEAVSKEEEGGSVLLVVSIIVAVLLGTIMLSCCWYCATRKERVTRISEWLHEHDRVRRREERQHLVRRDIRNVPEGISQGDIEMQVMRNVQSAVDGNDVESVTTMTPGLTPVAKQNAINSLLGSKKLVIEQAPGGVIPLKVNTSQQIAGTEEEQVIYGLVEESKTRGIWMNELREGSGLSQLQFDEALKGLETKKLIKSIKAVGTTRKCYIISDIEPDMSLTGGTFYSNQQHDSELINTLISVITAFANSRRKLAIEENPNNIQLQREASYIRPQEIAQYISEKRFPNFRLSLEDLEKVLEVAVLDGSIERRADGKVRACPPRSSISPLVSVPCAVCPVVEDCRPGYVISP